MDKSISRDELAIFDSYNTNNFARVKEIKIIPELSTFDNYDKLDNYNLEKKIFKPFSRGHISKTEILQLLENLDESLIASFVHNAKIHPIKSIEGDNTTIKAISDVFKRKNQSDLNILFFQASNNYETAFHEIERIIHDNESYKTKKINFGYLLSRYAYYKEESKSLKLLETVIKNLNPNTEIGTSYTEIPSIFEQLIYSENAQVSLETEKLLIDYLDKNPFSDTYYFNHSFKKISSDYSKNYLKSRIEKLQTDKEKQYFNANLLSHYTRLFGYRVFPYLKDNLTLQPDQIEVDTSYNAIKILDNSNEVVFHKNVEALVILVQGNKLTESEKQSVISFLNEIQLPKIGWYYWREYIEVIKAMYPTATLATYTANFRSSDLDKVQDHWDQRIYDVHEVDNYLLTLHSFGFSKHLHPKEKLSYILSNMGDNREVIIWKLLEKTGIALSYDSESGFYPPNYNSILSEYFNFCRNDIQDLKYEIAYEKVGSDKILVKLFLSDNSNTLEIEARDQGDWYDCNSIDAIFNLLLVNNKIQKRFINVRTGDQSRLLLYCEPEQAARIQHEFGLQLEYKIKQE